MFNSEVTAFSNCLVLPRFVLNELVETEKMYVDDLGQIVEVVISSPSQPHPTYPFPLPEDISRDGIPLYRLPSASASGLCVGATRGLDYTLIVASHPSHRVTWLLWLLRGFQRVFEAVTGLCSGTYSKFMSGTESE